MTTETDAKTFYRGYVRVTSISYKHRSSIKDFLYEKPNNSPTQKSKTSWSAVANANRQTNVYSQISRWLKRYAIQAPLLKISLHLEHYNRNL